MKNTISFRLMALLFGVALLISCSKEAPGFEKQKSTALQKTEPVSKESQARVIPQDTGSLIGLLSPVPAKAVITAYNINYSPANDLYPPEQTIANDDGSFRIDNLAGGIYYLVIDYVPAGANAYSQFIVRDVKVKPNSVIDLGTITLP